MRSGSTSRPASARRPGRRAAGTLRARRRARPTRPATARPRARAGAAPRRRAPHAWPRAWAAHASVAHRDGGVVLVRHRRRAAARALAHLAHLGLGEQDDVARDLRARRGGRGERRAELDQRAAVGVPRHRAARPGRARGRRGARPRARASPSTASVPTAPPSCAAQPLAPTRSRPARGPRAAPTSQPAAFSPNVVGTACCSSVRPAIGVDAVRPRERARSGLGGSPSHAAVGASARLRDEHRGGVDDVLAGRAPVHEPGRLRADRRADRAHERLGRVARDAPGPRRARPRRRGRPAALGDRARPACAGIDAGDRLGVHERPLGVEHGGEPGLVGHGVARARPAGRGARTSSQGEERGLPSPCRWMSKRRPPSVRGARSARPARRR